jgi:hypothetical protein
MRAKEAEFDKEKALMLQRNELLEVKINDLEIRLAQKKKEFDYQVACFGKNEGSPFEVR